MADSFSNALINDFISLGHTVQVRSVLILSLNTENAGCGFRIFLGNTLVLLIFKVILHFDEFLSDKDKAFSALPLHMHEQGVR